MALAMTGDVYCWKRIANCTTLLLTSGGYPSRRSSIRSSWTKSKTIVLAAGLRFHLLGAQSLWNDEGSSYAMTQRVLPDILANTAADIHPPGYYILLAGWVQVAGTSEFALRAFSALQRLPALKPRRLWLGRFWTLRAPKGD